MKKESPGLDIIPISELNKWLDFCHLPHEYENIIISGYVENITDPMSAEISLRISYNNVIHEADFKSKSFKLIGEEVEFSDFSVRTLTTSTITYSTIELRHAPGDFYLHDSEG